MPRLLVVVVAVALLAVDLPLAQSAAPPPRKVAFLVGVGAFQFDPKDLNGSPQKDVTALADVLRAGGFEVVVLKDADATKAAVEARFKALLAGDGNAANAIGKKDLLLVAVCTHGFTLPPAAGKPDQPFLAAHDTKLNQPDTMVPLNGLIDAAKSSGATCLYLLDACRETPADPNRGDTRGVEGENVILPKKTTILFSCGRGQVAHQHENVGGHGLFTAAVLRALRTESGTPKDDVSWTELVAGVQKSFRSAEFKAMIPAGKPQAPVLALGGEFDDAHLMTVKPAFGDDLLRLIPDEPTTVVLVDVQRASQGKIGKFLIDNYRTSFREAKSANLPVYEAALKDAGAVLLSQYAIDSGLGDFSMALTVRDQSDFVRLFAAAIKDARTVTFENQSVHVADDVSWATVGGTRVLVGNQVTYYPANPPSREFKDVFGGLATRKLDADRGSLAGLIKAADPRHHVLLAVAGQKAKYSLAWSVIAEQFAGEGLKSHPEAQKKEFDQAKGEIVTLSAGVTLGDQLVVEVNVALASTAAAKSLARVWDAAGKTYTDPVSAALGKVAKVTVQDKVVTIHGTLTERQVVELLKEIK